MYLITTQHLFTCSAQDQNLPMKRSDGGATLSASTLNPISVSRELRGRVLGWALLSLIFVIPHSALPIIDLGGQAYAQEPELNLPPTHKPQRALDLREKTGVGFVEAPLNIRGLALSFGINSNIFFESIIGGDWRAPDGRSPETQLGVALGLHLQLLQARDQIALTIGSRFHAHLSEPCTTETQLCAERKVTSTLGVQYLVDIPIRVYWFPHPNLSLHTEFGVSLRWGSSGASSDGISVDGYSVYLFNEASRMGNIGMTFWF